MSADPLPDGYERRAVRGVEVVALHWAIDALAGAVEKHGSLYRWAQAQPVLAAFRGRGVAWATELRAGVGAAAVTPVVVRHSRHGGALQRLTGDLFLLPTRAPRELAMSVTLAERGVMTPELVGYAVSPAFGLFARADVMTRRLPEGRDFPDAWTAGQSPKTRTAIIDAVAALMRALAKANAHHPDFNVKNVYIAGQGTACLAYVLDVDVMRLDAPGDVAALNFARFARSVRKWNDLHSLGVDDDALVRLASQAWVHQ